MAFCDRTTNDRIKEDGRNLSFIVDPEYSLRDMIIDTFREMCFKKTMVAEMTIIHISVEGF